LPLLTEGSHPRNHVVSGVFKDPGATEVCPGLSATAPMTIRAASSVARALSRPVLRPPHTHVQCRRRAVSTTAAAVPVALGLDFGTESVRAVLVSLEGTEVGSAVRPFDHGVITGSLPGGSTTLGPEHVAQHAGDWVECAGAAVKEVLAATDTAAEKVIGIGVDFTSCTLLPTTKQGEPLQFYNHRQENASFAPFHSQNDHLTETGSGQT
jgi:hypothetical protein